VTLTFTEAEIYQWQSIGEPVAQAVVTTQRVRGQVSAFDSMREGPRSAHTGVSFHLSLLDVAGQLLRKVRGLRGPRGGVQGLVNPRVPRNALTWRDPFDRICR
jgi:hypothetical protein